MAEFTCRNVWEKHEPVLMVVHDSDGDWQLLCDGDEHDQVDEIVTLHAAHLIERDPSLQFISDLPLGMEANRESLESPWVLSEMKP